VGSSLEITGGCNASARLSHALLLAPRVRPADDRAGLEATVSAGPPNAGQLLCRESRQVHRRATLSKAVSVESRLKNWKIINLPALRRARRVIVESIQIDTVDQNRTFGGPVQPAMMFRSVDFPQPDGP